jgi:hypothetical protein
MNGCTTGSFSRPLLQQGFVWFFELEANLTGANVTYAGLSEGMPGRRDGIETLTRADTGGPAWTLAIW